MFTSTIQRAKRRHQTPTVPCQHTGHLRQPLATIWRWGTGQQRMIMGCLLLMTILGLKSLMTFYHRINLSLIRSRSLQNQRRRNRTIQSLMEQRCQERTILHMTMKLPTCTPARDSITSPMTLTLNMLRSHLLQPTHTLNHQICMVTMIGPQRMIILVISIQSQNM